MKLLPCRCSLICLLVSCFIPAAWAQNATRVHKIIIRHVGPPAVSDELVRANIRIKEGDSYEGATADNELNSHIASDIRNLYTTGYFYNVRVGQQITPEGIDLSYVVQGKPLLSAIKFQGNKKYSNAKLSKKVTAKIGEPLDELKLFTSNQEILKMYQKAGYQKTIVKPVSLSIDENAGRGTATFEIIESPKVKILLVEFEGAQAFKEKKLRKVIKTRRRWAFSWLTGSGRLKDEEFDDDKEKLADFYRNEGYIDFELKDVKFDYPAPKEMIIRIVISEGRQYKVGAVEFKGNTLYSSNDFFI
jgi:outer membrane protein insertion porin family